MKPHILLKASELINPVEQLSSSRKVSLRLEKSAHGDVHPQARWEQYEDHTAQRPAMAHSTRLAERNITLQHLMKTYARERIRGVRGLALFDLIKQEVF